MPDNKPNWGDGYDDAMAGRDRRPEWNFDLIEDWQLEYQRGFSHGVHEKVNARYPGYDNEHSSPPSWFDPADAGESW